MELGPTDFEFVQDRSGLQYNQLLKLLSTQSRVAGGRGLGHTLGVTIGQAFIQKNQDRISREAKQKAVELGPDLVEQFSRSYLWRTYGYFQSVRGSSGSPIEVVGESAGPAGHQPRTILGFQNFEWRGDTEFSWGLDDKAITIHGEEYSTAAIMTTVYSFYGSYQLPDAIGGAKIKRSASPL